MHFPRWPLILATLLALGLTARGQEFLGKKLVTPRLVADTTTIVPAKPFTVGVHLKMAPGWHTYWRFGGDSGAPTRIDWELPAGFQAGPIQWPLPVAHLDEGDVLTFICEHEVMLLVEITPPATLPPEEVTLRAKLQWLVCEKTCIPGDGDVALTLPVSEQAAPANAELFAQWRAQLPKVSGAPFEVSWDIRGDAVTLRVADLPQEFRAEFFPIPPAPEVKPGHPKASEVAADGTRTITFPVEGGSPGLAWEGVLVTQQGDAPREGWSIASGPDPQKSTGVSRVSAGASQTNLLSVLWAAFAGGLILNLMPCVLPVIALKIFGFVQQAGENPRRVFHLGLAFVAGVFAFFLALAALVVAFQATGSGLTWGFQFQNSYILTILVALVFVFALSMFGVFEVVLGSGTATALDSLSRKDGLSGAFTHGLFTTLLGTSCTAPLLGSALGFAFVQPAPIVFLIFAVIAAGMSLPYFLLTWKPAWMRLLPKPGAWMERLKQFMGFVLLAVVVWLLGVVGETRNLDAVVAVSSFLLVVAVGCWVFGFARRAIAWPVLVILVAAGWLGFIHGRFDVSAVASNSASGGGVKNLEGGIPWETFTPERLEEALGRGDPVFIDFTASWCLNCKYNERFVLETEPVREAFRKLKIVPIKADWSNKDPVITEMLKKFGKIGVPVYVFYPGGASSEPIVLPEILTQSSLLDHFAQIKS